MPENDKQNCSTEQQSTDSVVLELLRIVQNIDTKLDNHIAEEMGEIHSIISQIKEHIQEVVDRGFVDGDLDKHKTTHRWINPFNWFRK